MTDAVNFGLGLAGIDFAITLHDVRETDHVHARYGSFEKVPAVDAIQLSIARDESLRVEQPSAVAWPGALGTVLDDGSIRFQRSDETMRYDVATRRATACVARPIMTALAPVQDPTSVDTPLRLLLSYELPKHRGLLLHAAGYADERGAVVFCAVSGGGKTTTARKLTPPNVLSDDQVAVRFENGCWIAHALPFVGEYAKAITKRDAPLRSVIFLAKSGGAITRRRLRPAEASARLLGCAPMFVRAADSAERLLACASQLAGDVAAYEYAVPRDWAVMSEMDELLRT